MGTTPVTTTQWRAYASNGDLLGEKQLRPGQTFRGEVQDWASRLGASHVEGYQRQPGGPYAKHEWTREIAYRQPQRVTESAPAEHWAERKWGRPR